MIHTSSQIYVLYVQIYVIYVLLNLVNFYIVYLA